MSEDGPLARRLARTVAGIDQDGSVVDRFCEAGQLMLDGDGAAITASYDRPDRHTLSSTSALASMIEDAQDVAGEGPGFDAVQTGDVVSADFGMLTPTPWPLLEDSVAALGFTGSILALPLATAGRSLGALVVHKHHSALSFDPPVAAFLGRNLGAALIEQLDPEELERELTDDWSTRAVVHQATGMVAVQLHIRPDDALVVLRAHAYGDGTSLVDVAAAVVDRDLTFDGLVEKGDHHG